MFPYVLDPRCLQMTRDSANSGGMRMSFTPGPKSHEPPSMQDTIARVYYTLAKTLRVGFRFGLAESNRMTMDFGTILCYVC